MLSTALNISLFWVGFRVLTAREVSWRQLRGGAIGAGVLYELLQTLGGYYIGHVVKDAGNLYGTFALVIGLLSWIYLGTHITLLAAEGNVVATRRLWPRSFSFMIEQPATQADQRALAQRGKVEERRGDVTVSIEFPDAPNEQEEDLADTQPWRPWRSRLKMRSSRRVGGVLGHQLRVVKALSPGVGIPGR